MGLERFGWYLTGASYVILATAVSGAELSTLLGDPGMRGIPAVMWEGWSFCNGALQPTPYQGVNPVSPRFADCLDGNSNLVSEADNNLLPGDTIPGFGAVTDVNAFAQDKELYLGGVCSKQPFVPSSHLSGNWSFWTVMFKSGIINQAEGLCPMTVDAAIQTGSSKQQTTMPDVQLGTDLMIQPLMTHAWSNPNSTVPYNGTGIVGYYAGTYDWNASMTPTQLAAIRAAVDEYTLAWITYRFAEVNDVRPLPPRPTPPSQLFNASFLMAAWYQNVTDGTWVIYNGMLTTATYPWLMNYFRSDGVTGGNGGYPFEAKGVMYGPAPTLGTTLQVRLRIIEAGEVHTQFYLPEISGCWKLDGSPCDGNLTSDVTRYICYMISPNVKTGSCSATHQASCPPYHVFLNGTVVYRNNTASFPYGCYYMWCPSPNSGLPGSCDPYSNPNPQELLQLLPCEEWAPHGFPSAPGQGWVGDDRLWDLDVGTLGARLYLNGQNPTAPPSLPATAVSSYPGWGRYWVSFEVGPEQMDSSGTGWVRWEVLEWDVRTNASTLEL